MALTRQETVNHPVPSRLRDYRVTYEVIEDGADAGKFRATLVAKDNTYARSIVVDDIPDGVLSATQRTRVRALTRKVVEYALTGANIAGTPDVDPDEPALT